MIHPTAVVDPDARLGANVEIGPHAVIAGHVDIGDGCRIGPHVVMLPFTSLGPGCRVHTGVVLGDEPQDLGFGGGESYVRIGARCVLREFVTVHRGTKAGTATVMGDDCYLMANAHLAHNVCLGRKVIVVNAALLAGYVEVGDGAFIGGAVVIHQYVRIGRLAMLGGSSGLGKDVPPFCMVAGMHLNRVAGLNVVGQRRAGIAPEQRREIKRAFTLLYRSGLNVSAAEQAIRAEFKVGPALEIADFVAGGKRGICAMRTVAPAAEAED